MKNFKTFPAKILLFGEHIINKGSNGLAIPFHKYNCKLSFENNKDTLKESTEVLNLIYNQINKDENLSNLFDTINLHQDIVLNDLNINMNIPIGYGLGSSGAICAGVYDYYCSYKKENPKKVQKILGLVESAFHGKSSGLDPIVSLLDRAVLVKENATELVDFSIANINGFKLFLIDTKNARKTEPLVNKFLTKYNTKLKFSKIVSEKIVPLTNEIIEDFVSLNFDNTYAKIKNLSILQIENFKEFILEEHIQLWEKGIKNDDFYLKICGAGGGGFMLGFYKDKSKVTNVFKEDDIIFL